MDPNEELTAWLKEKKYTLKVTRPSVGIGDDGRIIVGMPQVIVEAVADPVGVKDSKKESEK